MSVLSRNSSVMTRGGGVLVGSGASWYPAGVALTVSLPMTTSAANPPIDESGCGHTPEIGSYADYEYEPVSPEIQSAIRLPGAAYSGHTPDYARWYFGMSNSWNTLAGCSFVIEADVYLPSGALTTTWDWSKNIIYGGGGPNSGCPQFGVGVVAGVPRLLMSDGAGIVDTLSSVDEFPMDEWINVGVSFNLAKKTAQLRMNGEIVAKRTQGSAFTEVGPWREYNLGSAEWNEWVGSDPLMSWAMWWKGYICNFKLHR